MDTDIFEGGQRVAFRYRNLDDGRVECDIHGDVIVGLTVVDCVNKYVSEHVWAHPGVVDSGWRESMPIRINGFTFFRRKSLFLFWSRTWLCPDGVVVTSFRDSEAVYRGWVARGRVVVRKGVNDRLGHGVVSQNFVDQCVDAVPPDGRYRSPRA